MAVIKIMRLFVAGMTILLSLTTPAAGLSKKQKGATSAVPPTFAVIPFYSPEKIWSLYMPFINYLRKTTGDPWQLQLYSTHDQFIDGICNGTITAGIAGPAPLAKIQRKCGVKPFLAALGKDGTPHYHSVILANDPAVKKLAHLKGKRVGFFRGSTAAHIVPMKLFGDAGLTMNDFAPIFLSSQDRIIQRLLSGDIAAAGVKEALAAKFSGKILTVVAVSDPLPNFALCAAPSASASVIKRLNAALTQLHPSASRDDARTVSGWDDEIRHGFIPADDSYFAAILKFNDTFGGDK